MRRYISLAALCAAATMALLAQAAEDRTLLSSAEIKLTRKPAESATRKKKG